MCVCIYIYIYMRERERERGGSGRLPYKSSKGYWRSYGIQDVS